MRSKRIVFCNDRYLEIYGMTRSDIRTDMTGPELLALRRKRGVLDVSIDEFYRGRRCPRRPHHRIARRAIDRRQILRAAERRLGGDARGLQRAAPAVASNWRPPSSFWNRCIDNVPVCVAAKSIEDGRYILANRAFEQFSRLSREQIVGKRADEIFKPADRGDDRGGRPGRDRIARRPVPQRIRRRARLGEAHARQQPRDRPRRARTSRNS